MNTNKELDERIKSWHRMCLGKVRMSEGHADKLVTRVKMNDGVELRKYYCPHCFGWHVTSQK